MILILAKWDIIVLGRLPPETPLLTGCHGMDYEG